MPRRYSAPKRQIEPDVRYNSELVAEFITRVMHSGKKSVATRVVYQAMDLIEERAKRPAMEVFEEAVRSVAPVVEVKPRRVGGSTYQVPIEVAPDRQVSLALRWIMAAAQKRPGHSMAEKLAGEFVDAANKTGAAIKKREDTHKMAEANRAFAHYRW